MMVLNLMCGVCMQECINKGSLFVNEFSVPISEIREDCVYDVVCEKGHQSKCLLTNQKFELLFEIGLNDYIDGSYRGAVSSFAAALERFYEFFIKVVLEQSTHLPVLWKQVQNQSERQLGAFLFLYLKQIGEMPPVLSEKEISFRNKVIHKGYIPNAEEVLVFGESVRSIVNRGLRALKSNVGEDLQRILDKYTEDIAVEHQVEFACNISPVLDVTFGPDFGSDDVRQRTLEEIGAHILERRSPQRLRVFKTREERDATKRLLGE